MLPPLLTKEPMGLKDVKSIQQLSIGRFENIYIIFPLRSLLGSPEVIKGQSLIDVSLLFRKCVIVSGTVLARRRQMISINSFLTLLLIRSS